MSRKNKRRSKKAGLPPGALIHIGEEKVKKIDITLIDYDETRFKEERAKSIEECLPFKDTPTVTWIDIYGIHDPEIMEKIGNLFGLHPLTLEDIMNTNQRPKIENFGEHIFIVLKMLSYNEEKNDIEIEQVSLILGSNYVISFQEREGDIFDPIRDRIRTNKGRIRKQGNDYLAYALLDSIVDSYFGILENAGEKIEDTEEYLLTYPGPRTLNEIHRLKQMMMNLRKSIWPLREVINGLTRDGTLLIAKSTEMYLRDVYDHTIQVIDTIETYRDMISGMLDIYLSTVSNKMNEIMKVLTIIATIFIPLTFITGLYGMNFKYMPELEWHSGYFISLGVMLIVTILLVIFFKKKKWF